MPEIPELTQQQISEITKMKEKTEKNVGDILENVTNTCKQECHYGFVYRNMNLTRCDNTHCPVIKKHN